MTNSTKILIVDDEVLISEFLKDILISFSFSDIQLAHNMAQTFFKIEQFQPELILMDIRMERELEGIEIAQKLNDRYTIPFIFITAHSDENTIQKALNTNPAGYIIKPFKKMDVYAAINLAIITDALQNEKTLIFKDGYGTVKIPVDDILFAKSDGNYIDLFTQKKIYTIRYSLDWLLENLPENEFKKTHRSYLVNVKKIEKITAKSVFISNTEIPVSRNNPIDFLSFET
jgi:two-component system response regulator LytT